MSLDLTTLFPFDLDQFQLDAIDALNANQSVVICAPTGSGKTLIGEYAIHKSLHERQRVFYTTPLKALSNQKYRDFQNLFSPDRVGLITGDEVENPQAEVVVMTTEIFRNMLYETPVGAVGTSLRNVGAVVLDECHYLNDPQRGTVWEECIIYCPAHIQLVGLSATIGNAQDFTNWINQVRQTAAGNDVQEMDHCVLINSNHRPVPLTFYFSNNQRLVPLFDERGKKINPKLKRKLTANTRGRNKDVPTPAQVVAQLQDHDFLPAIYIIFSRKGCDEAIANLAEINLLSIAEQEEILFRILGYLLTEDFYLQAQVLEVFKDYDDVYTALSNFCTGDPGARQELNTIFQANPAIKGELLQFMEANSQMVRSRQLEPLTRGIAAHHAGILPPWKKMVEELFEAGLVKVVFATSTLAAGINMPARSTVLSALSKRNDTGHALLTSSEFLQIAGRAGRRGLDTVGYVVVNQTRFEGVKEAMQLATEQPEPLESKFTPSYGMVLNLLQKHSLGETKSLLQRSFAEYLAKSELGPEQQAITEVITAITRIDLELAAVNEYQLKEYAKLTETLKEERRILSLVEVQAQQAQKQEIAGLLTPALPLGSILHLYGKNIKNPSPVRAALIQTLANPGQALAYICLGEDRRWYIALTKDVVDINQGSLPEEMVQAITVPELTAQKLGKWCKAEGDATLALCEEIDRHGFEAPIDPELAKLQKRVQGLEGKLANHPLGNHPKINHLLAQQERRSKLRKKLKKSRKKYDELTSTGSYYWQDFLNLLAVLQQAQAMVDHTPTILGQVAAVMRSENELWLALVTMFLADRDLRPEQLAAIVAAVNSYPTRPHIGTSFAPSQPVMDVVGELKTVKKDLETLQRNHDVEMNVALEPDLVGIVEQWALGKEWMDIMEETNLDEGDVVRTIRRTIDVLLQLTQIRVTAPKQKEYVNPFTKLESLANQAIAQMKRFPL